MADCPLLAQSGHAERRFDHFQPASLTRYDALLGALGLVMRRRAFVKGIGGSAIAWPLAARAQQPLMPTIGILGSTSSRVQANFLRAFQQGLGEAGYVEGRNATIEYRWADDQNEKLPALAADLVRRHAERRRVQNCNELAMPGDYHLPFGKTEARAEAAKWVWQV